MLVDVHADNIVQAERIVLRPDRGDQRSFRVGPEVPADKEHPATASHLRQHVLTAEPVIIRYRETPEGPVATQIRDAPAAPASR